MLVVVLFVPTRASFASHFSLPATPSAISISSAFVIRAFLKGRNKQSGYLLWLAYPHIYIYLPIKANMTSSEDRVFCLSVLVSFLDAPELLDVLKISKSLRHRLRHFASVIYVPSIRPFRMLSSLLKCLLTVFPKASALVLHYESRDDLFHALPQAFLFTHLIELKLVQDGPHGADLSGLRLLSTIPKTLPTRLKSLSLINIGPISPSCLAAFTSPHLQHLTLTNSPSLADFMLQDVCALCPSLVSLNLDGVPSIVSPTLSLSNLQELRVIACPSLRQIDLLVRHDKLRLLDFSFSYQLACLPNLSYNLRHLVLSYNQELENLELDCPSLQYLTVNWCSYVTSIRLDKCYSLKQFNYMENTLLSVLILNDPLVLERVDFSFSDSLEQLSIDCAPILKECLLYECPSLQSVTLKGTSPSVLKSEKKLQILVLD